MKRARAQSRAGGAIGAVDVLCAVAGAPPAARVRAWIRILLSTAGVKRPLSLSVLLCGDRRMRSLNRAWRGEERATDVLSFPSFEESLGRAAGPRGAFLGDLVIDVPYAARQARRRGHATSREIRILLAHGLLHLLGYDHETDDGTMFRLQGRLIRSAFGAGPDGVP